MSQVGSGRVSSTNICDGAQESAQQEKVEPAAPPPPPPAESAAPKQEAAEPAAAAALAGGRPRKRGQGVSFTDIPNSQIRKIIAKRLLESKLTVPHYYLRGHADLATVTALRQMLKEQGAKVGASLTRSRSGWLSWSSLSAFSHFK